MSDPQALAIVAATLLGKEFTRQESGMTVPYKIDTMQLAISHAKQLLEVTNPFLQFQK